MKTSIVAAITLVLFTLSGCTTAPATDEDRDELLQESHYALQHMETQDHTLKEFLSNSAGFAVFPTVGKGGLIAGGAYGRGAVYEKSELIGYSDITQATIGVQAGGQSYRELIVFQDKHDLQRFTGGKLTISANLSAVALKSGAAESARYTDGVAVFVEPIGGLMVEAAIGGQQFTYETK